MRTDPSELLDDLIEETDALRELFDRAGTTPLRATQPTAAALEQAHATLTASLKLLRDLKRHNRLLTREQRRHPSVIAARVSRRLACLRAMRPALETLVGTPLGPKLAGLFAGDRTFDRLRDLVAA